MKESLIPLAHVSDYFPVYIDTFPPFRSELFFDETILRSTLQNIQIDDRLLRLNFIQYKPLVKISPQSASQGGETVGTMDTFKEKRQPRELVTVDMTENETVRYFLTYTSKNTKTPQETTAWANRALKKCIFSTPLETWSARGAKELHTNNSSRVQELAIQIYKLGYTAILTAAGLAYSVEAGITLFGITYTLGSALDLLEGYLYKVGKTDDFRAQLISENWRRALWPVTFQNEVITPGILYSLSSAGRNDILIAK